MVVLMGRVPYTSSNEGTKGNTNRKNRDKMHSGGKGRDYPNRQEE